MAAIMILAVSACKDKANEADTTTAKDTATAEASAITYAVDKAGSSIAWKGTKPLGAHNGTIALENGTFSVNNGAIESGTFSINMNSIVVTDIPADDEDNAKLSGHLKSPDFFNVEAHPTATFEITGFETKDGKNLLSGNLNIKGKENNITIPVAVNESENGVTITSEPFSIDRTKWDIRYGSKTFFDNLGDRFINDDIELKITIKGKKA